MEYTVIGDNVNLTSRIEDLTKDRPDSILISHSTYDKVKEFFEIDFLNPLRVRGKLKPVRIYEVMGLKRGSGHN